MKNRSKMMRRALAATALLLPLAAANAAISEGQTSDGRRYLTGGIGSEEVETLRHEAPAYSLQLITAARGGAYLSGTHVRLVGPGNNVVLDTTLTGPWLLIDLPGGRYTVRATHGGQTVERAVTITPGKSQQVVVHFNVPVDQGDTPVAQDAHRAGMDSAKTPVLPPNR